MKGEKRILVVDDDLAILDILQEVLLYYGYNVATLSKGDQVFSKIDEYHPNLILMDVMLAGMDGRAICKAIKSTATVSHIPVILISATENVGSCMSQDIPPDDFVEKPFDVSYLISRIEYQLVA